MTELATLITALTAYRPPRPQDSDYIARKLGAYLDAHPGSHTTAELAEALIPSAFKTAAAESGRTALFKWLLSRAEKLPQYASRGEPKVVKRYGKEVTVRPWFWQKPKPAIGKIAPQRWGWCGEGLTMREDGEWVAWADIEAFFND